MNEGLFFKKAFYKNKSFTIDEFLEKVSFERSTLFKLFRKKIIPDKYKKEIEIALEIKFPKPYKSVSKEYEESNSDLESKEWKDLYFSEFEKNKILNDKLVRYEQEIEKLKKN